MWDADYGLARERSRKLSFRPHRSLARKPPLDRLGDMNNVVGTNS